MIKNLRSYLAHLETQNTKKEKQISYNADEKWRKPVLFWRRCHDGAAAVLVVAGNLYAYFAMKEMYPEQVDLSNTVFFITAAIALCCFGAVLWPAFAKRWKPT
jgi:hypothetical protein